MLYQLLPIFASACTLAALIPPQSHQARQLPGLPPVSTNFNINFKLEKDVRIRLKEWPALPKAAEGAGRSLITGPTGLQVEGVQDINQWYLFTKWVDRAEGTYIDECKVWWSWYGPSGDAQVDLSPTSWVTNQVVTFHCEGEKLDPASGPYITLEPHGYQIDITKPPMFGGKRFNTGETAVFKGVSYMNRDNIEFEIYNGAVHKCVVGTRDGRSQSKDITFTLASLQTENNDQDPIPTSFISQDNVGIQCQKQ